MAGIKKPSVINTNYARKPYIPGEYDDQKELMNRPSRRAMEMQRESPRSYEDKPYTEDTDDYQALEHWAPRPFPLRSADINLQIWPASPGPVPSVDDWDVPTDTDCFVNCLSPGRDCTDPVRCWMGVNQGGWERYMAEEVSIKVYVNGDVYTDWSYDSTVPNPLTINAPSGGWTLNPPGPADLVDVLFLSKVDGTVQCQAIVVNIFCAEEGCSCAAGDGYVAISIDTGSTPETIDPDSSVEVYVQDGCPPYSWAVTGVGYYFALGTAEGLVNTLYSPAGTCGADYGAVAAVTVTDNCGNAATIDIRNTGGEWSPFPTDQCTATGNDNLTYYLNLGKYRYRVDFDYSGGAPAPNYEPTLCGPACCQYLCGDCQCNEWREIYGYQECIIANLGGQLPCCTGSDNIDCDCDGVLYDNCQLYLAVSCGGSAWKVDIRRASYYTWQC